MMRHGAGRQRNESQPIASVPGPRTATGGEVLRPDVGRSARFGRQPNASASLNQHDAVLGDLLDEDAVVETLALDVLVPVQVDQTLPWIDGPDKQVNLERRGPAPC